MIGFRYHIVSLTAVFLALSIGVIAGTTVIPRPLLNDLRKERDRITANNATVRARAADLEQRAAMWETYGKETFAGNIKGALRGVTVTRIVTGAPPKALLDQIGADLVSSGAVAGGTLVLTDRNALKDQRARDALGTALASSDRDSKDLWRTLGERLATRLREPADPRLETDLLKLLDDEGFLNQEDVSPGRFPDPRALLLVISGGQQALGAPFDPFVTALATGLADTRTVVAEPLAAPDGGVEGLLAVTEVRNSVGTVDHVDSAVGRYAMIAALLRENTTGAPLHLGVGERASGIAPPEVRQKASPTPAPTPTGSR